MARYPNYRKVYDQLKSHIQSDEYPPNTLIPSEPELCALYAVSRTTIRKAIELLEKEGLVHVQQGRGTEVLDHTATQNLNTVTSFSETIRNKGYDVSLRSIFIDEFVPSKKVLEKLGLLDGTSVIRIQRIHLADDRPVAIMTNYLRPEIAPGILGDGDKISSLYTYLENVHHVKITHADDTIRAVGADFIQSQLLEIPIGYPLLLNHRITYSDDLPIEVVHMAVDGSRYEFSTHLSGR